MPASTAFDVAIVGGGASGTLLAMHLLRHADAPLRIALLEPGIVGHGVAYGTSSPVHLLNVPAGRMAAFDDIPGDFVDFLQSTGAPDATDAPVDEGFMQRLRYAAYLRDRLARAARDSRASLEVIAERVLACDASHGNPQLTLASGRPLRARQVVLALGNAARPLPGTGAAALPPGVVLAGWDDRAIAALDPAADVTVVGCGLSMVDVAMVLHARGHRGLLHAVSRNALLPLPHLPVHRTAHYPVDELARLPLHARVRRLRSDADALAAAGVPWQDLMNALRPHVRMLWQTLGTADQARFLRHVARYWDVHRHRIAPRAHEVLGQLRAEGRLHLHRGRIARFDATDTGMQITLAMRDGTSTTWQSAHVVNASGVELRARGLGQPLLDRLLQQEAARPGPHGLGIDTDAEGRVLRGDGGVHPALSAIGSLRIGSLLESIAVPDLRGDAGQLARRLCTELQPD